MRGLWLGVALALLLGVEPVWAADSVADNAGRLREAKDFRVRTQAALALGASADPRAVTPLCTGLDDENRTVRIAAASGLGKLHLGGEKCLTERLGREKDALVKTSLQRALEQLNSGGGSAEPVIDKKTRVYLAIDKLAGPAAWDGPLRSALVRAAGTGVAFAPRGETPSQGGRVLGQFGQARGFSLAFKVGAAEYEGDQLGLKLSVVILSYPGKAILGSFSQKAAMGGVHAPAPEAEQELLVDLAGSALKKFLTLAPTLDE